MKPFSLLLSLLIVAGIAYWFVFRHDTAAVAEAPPAETPTETTRPAIQPVPVLVIAVAAEETPNRLLMRGRTKANRTVDVRAETEGRVISLPRRRGTEVVRGEALCQLDPGVSQARLTEALARLTEAQAEAEAATQLQKRGFTADTTLKTRQAELQAAQAEVDLVKLDIVRRAIVSPFSGVLESDTAELGTRLGVGETCAKVIDLSRVVATAYVSEQAVDKISIGQHAVARLINGREAEGKITFISRMADEETRTYQVDVTIPNTDGRIRDGMTAEILIDLPAISAHRLPQSALTLDDEGRLGVRLAVDGHARFAPVRLIRDEPDGAWVAGLPETARVIVAGQEFVRDGREIIATPTTMDDLG